MVTVKKPKNNPKNKPKQSELRYAQDFGRLFVSTDFIDRPAAMGVKTAYQFGCLNHLVQVYMRDLMPAFNIWFGGWQPGTPSTSLRDSFGESYLGVLYDGGQKELVYDLFFQRLLNPPKSDNLHEVYKDLLHELDTLCRLASKSYFYLFEVSCCIFQIAMTQFTLNDTPVGPLFFPCEFAPMVLSNKVAAGKLQFDYRKPLLTQREPFFTITMNEAIRYLNRFRSFHEAHHQRQEEERIKKAQSEGGRTSVKKNEGQYNQVLALLIGELSSGLHQEKFTKMDDVTDWLVEKLTDPTNDEMDAEKLHGRISEWSKAGRGKPHVRELYGLLIKVKQRK